MENNKNSLICKVQIGDKVFLLERGKYFKIIYTKQVDPPRFLVEEHVFNKEPQLEIKGIITNVYCDSKYYGLDKTTSTYPYIRIDGSSKCRSNLVNILVDNIIDLVEITEIDLY